MQADWNVACGADDPVIVVPWNNADGSLRFIDLRNAPGSINEIPEAAHYDCMAAALRRWNQPDSAIFTAKCDVWTYPADLFDAEDLNDFAFAHGSYIDLLFRDPKVFSNFPACERYLRRWSEAARSIAFPQSRCEWTLRPAHILHTMIDPLPAPGPDIRGGKYCQGYANTLYVWGYGSTPTIAASVWSETLMSLIEPTLFSK